MKFLTSRAAAGCNVSCGVLRLVEVLFWSQMGHEMDTESYRLLLSVHVSLYSLNVLISLRPHCFSPFMDHSS